MFSQKILPTVNTMTLLYVEDDEAIREGFARILRRFFKHVEEARNGEVGLEKFKELSPELIITDISMPIMDGITMAKMIKKIDSEIPIIVTSAHNDKEFLLDAIEVGISHYLIKPLNVENVSSIITQCIENILHKRELAEYKRELQNVSLKLKTQMIAEEVSDAFPIASLIILNGKAVYVNKAFTETFGNDAAEALFSDCVSFNRLICPKVGYASSIAEIVRQGNEKIIFKVGDKTKIYLIKSALVDWQEEASPATLITFTDITLLEYQQLKIQQYKARLEDFLTLYHHSNVVNAKSISPMPHSSMLKPEELDVLRRTHRHKLSAIEYKKELAVEILQELDELKDIEEEFLLALDKFHLDSAHDSSMLVRLMNTYAKTVALLLEFEDLSFALRTLASLIEELEYSTLSSATQRQIVIYLENILSDLTQWRKTLFVYADATDIHYLDSSLLSTCLQLEMAIYRKEWGDENDLELF